MNSKIKISIPEPCHENWIEMSPTEKGRFCSSCQKYVIDFTKSSDREISKIFNNNKNICGRFLDSQLDRNLIILREKKSAWLITISTVISFLNFGNQELAAQESVKTEQTDKKTIIPTDNKNTAIEIKGKIFLGELNPNFDEVEISIYGKDQIFHPDADGRFCIDANKHDRILIKKAGYIDYYTTVINSTNLGAIELDTPRISHIVGGAVAVKRSFWYRLFH